VNAFKLEMHLESCRQSEISSICINDLLGEQITNSCSLRSIIGFVVLVQGSEGVRIEGMLVHEIYYRCTENHTYKSSM
jgi:hypothetical protein